MYRNQIKQRAQELGREKFSPSKILDTLQTDKEFIKDFKYKNTLCEKTIRRWLKQGPVLAEEQKQKEVDIVVARSKHFDELAEIAGLLVLRFRGLRVKPNTSTINGLDMYIFEGNYDAEGDFYEREYWSRDELGSKLRTSINYCVGVKYSATQFECLLSHLEDEYPELESSDIYEIGSKKPYELIESLRLLASRKIFDGTCKVCESW